MNYIIIIIIIIIINFLPPPKSSPASSVDLTLIQDGCPFRKASTSTILKIGDCEPV